MRLWAALDTITFNEIAPCLGAVIDLSFRLSPNFVGSGRTNPGRRWPLDFGALGDKGLVQLPSLGRTFMALTGNLVRGGDSTSREAWLVESAVTLRLGAARKGTLGKLDEIVGHGERPTCQALGTLSIAGSELRMPGDPLHPARVVRFQSLCLRAGDPCFGSWSNVERYAELG